MKYRNLILIAGLLSIASHTVLAADANADDIGITFLSTSNSGFFIDSGPAPARYDYSAAVIPLFPHFIDAFSEASSSPYVPIDQLMQDFELFGASQVVAAPVAPVVRSIGTVIATPAAGKQREVPPAPLSLPLAQIFNSLDCAPSSFPPALISLRNLRVTDARKYSSLGERDSTVGSLSSIPSDGDLEDELNELMGSPAAVPANTGPVSQHKLHLCSSQESADGYPTDDETYMLSKELLGFLAYEVASPTEYAGSDSESDEYVARQSLPSLETPLVSVDALPAVFQAPVVTSPAPAAQLSSPLRPVHQSPTVTAGQKRRGAPVSISLTRMPSCLFDGE